MVYPEPKWAEMTPSDRGAFATSVFEWIKASGRSEIKIEHLPTEQWSVKVRLGVPTGPEVSAMASTSYLHLVAYAIVAQIDPILASQPGVADYSTYRKNAGYD